MTTQPDLFAGNDLEQGPEEFLATPPWFVEAILAQRALPFGERPRVVQVLDPGAGLGALGLAVEQRCAELARLAQPKQHEHAPTPAITAIEVHPGRVARLPRHWERQRADFLQWAPQQTRRWDLIVTNPPFRRWWPWIEACISLLERGGLLLAVAPWAYLGQRHPWWVRHAPACVHPFDRRPWPQSMRECCWVEWQERRLDSWQHGVHFSIALLLSGDWRPA